MTRVERYQRILSELGPDWREPIPTGLYDPRMYQRSELFLGKLRIVDEFLPEYREGGASVLDFSCGSGALLEVMRYYGNTILGTDIQYFEFLEAQQIPYQQVDGGCLPYPIKEDAFDLVTCIGSIQMYHRPWRNVVAELARIACRHVLVIVNNGEDFERRKGDLIGWSPDGWRQDMQVRSVFRWSRR